MPSPGPPITPRRSTRAAPPDEARDRTSAEAVARVLRALDADG